MIKTHKIALDPNKDQIAWFYQQCGYAKFAYNSAVSDFKTALSADTFLSKNQLAKRFNQKKKAYDWTQAQDQRAAKYSIDHLGCAIDNWRAKRAKFPKLKKRGCKHSYTTDEQAVRVEGKRIKLPKIGWVKTFQALRFRGKIVSVTISRTAHRWFASVSVEVQPPIHRCPASSEFVEWFASKVEVGTPHQVERIHYRIACIRRDAHHQATTDILISASSIGIETLSVTNLLKNRKLSKALSDAALGGFLEKLKTKAKCLGIPIIQADRFFASSKMCSVCGHKKDALVLSDRLYQCGSCGYLEDRDVNAAINLRNLAAGYAES